MGWRLEPDREIAASRHAGDVLSAIIRTREIYKYFPSARVSLMAIDPDSERIAEQHLPEEAEFPSVDFRHVGRRYRQAVMLACSTSKQTYGFDQVQRCDLERGTVDRYKKAALLSVFNAMALQDGPVAQSYLPYALPLGLHGQFVRT